MLTLERWLAPQYSDKETICHMIIAIISLVLIYVALNEVSRISIEWSRIKIISIEHAIEIGVKSTGEEVLFRFIPLAGIIYFLKGRIPKIGLMIVISFVIILSAVAWGYVHRGFAYESLMFVLPGVFLSGIYLKCGGYLGRTTRGLLAVWTVHLTSNFLIFGVVPLMYR